MCTSNSNLDWVLILTLIFNFCPRSAEEPHTLHYLRLPLFPTSTFKSTIRDAVVPVITKLVCTSSRCAGPVQELMS